MTFKEYVLDWFHQLVEEHYTDKEWQADLFHQLGYNETEYLDEGVSIYDFLLEMSDENEIYEALFGYEAKVKTLDDLPDTEGFLTRMFQEVGKDYIKEYDFANELLEDMAGNCFNYANPAGFFQDLQYGGCASGMIGMFIYHSDCKDFYIDYIDSMEDFVEELEDELGSPIKNEEKMPYYTFICWVCYEELAVRIANELWDGEI
jgi:hypothetical protein